MEISPVVKQIMGEIDFDPDVLHEKYLLERDKRLDRGTREYQEISGELSHFCEDPHADPNFKRDPINDEVDFLLIGAGYSSLLLGAQLRKSGYTAPNNLRLIDVSADVGGTWYWNRYPGAQCDTEGYVYMPMLEDTGSMPTLKYPFQPELLGQANKIADKYNLRDNAMFQTAVTGMTWNDSLKKWEITTDRGDNFKAKYVIMATGPLNRPKLPGIPGINSYKGHTFHTSRWDYGYTGGTPLGGLDKLKDKRVGIIGTGATAIQCIPHLAEAAKELYIFQRTPSCVDLRFNQPTDPEWVKSLKPGWQWERMVNFAEVLEGIEVEVDLVNDGWTVLYRKAFGPALRKAAEEVGRPLTGVERSQLLELSDYQNMNRIRAQISQIVKDPKTAEALKPWYRQFCKRPTFHDTYLECFNRPNVHLVDTDGNGVDRITPDGVVVAGEEYKVDCLIFATGFETETSYVHRAGYDVVGRNGRKLSDYWSNGLRTFFGVAVDGFPNMFLLGRTQSGASLNLLYGITQQIGHVVHMMSETEKRGATSVEATSEAVAEFLEEFWSHKRKADRYWAECTPGFFNNEGNVTDTKGFFSDVYGGGIRKFFQNFKAWRESGDMVGFTFEYEKDTVAS